MQLNDSYNISRNLGTLSSFYKSSIDYTSLLIIWSVRYKQDSLIVDKHDTDKINLTSLAKSNRAISTWSPVTKTSKYRCLTYKQELGSERVR